MRRNRLRSGLVDRRLVAHIASDLDLRAEEELERLDLGSFVRATAAYDAPPEERLRQLAIALEARVSFDSPLREWGAVERVYAAAIRLEPEDWVLHSSRSICASRLAEVTTDPRDLERLVRASDESLRRALELAPDAAELHYLAGYNTYVHRTGSTEDALGELERAIELDGSHGFARLYRAHCLHDLERFEEAAAAYDDVPHGAFRGPTSWRMDLLVEQRAHCRGMAGDLDGARADFERVLTRYEREPHLALYAPPRYRRWAADAFPELADRVEAVEAAATGHSS